MKQSFIFSMLIHLNSIISPFLEVGEYNPLAETIDRTHASWNEYNRGNSEFWGYTIDEKRPLTFRNSERPKHDCRVDIYCKVRLTESLLPVKQDIKIRVWSDDLDIIYREELDAKQLVDKFSNRGRVVSRYHFDMVDHPVGNRISNEYHPTYHMQIGGKSMDREYCWHPAGFDLPRIPHHPMDLLLVSQLVIANFFPNDYSTLRKKSEWIKAVKRSEKSLLEDYYEYCLKTIRGTTILSDSLPNYPNN